jgi:hypothetical protein
MTYKQNCCRCKKEFTYKRDITSYKNKNDIYLMFPKNSIGGAHEERPHEYLENELINLLGDKFGVIGNVWLCDECLRSDWLKKFMKDEKLRVGVRRALVGITNTFAVPFSVLYLLRQENDGLGVLGFVLVVGSSFIAWFLYGWLFPKYKSDMPDMSI